MHCSPIISWLILTILFAILNTSHFCSSRCITFPNLILSALHLACQTIILAFFFASAYFLLLVFPCFNSFHSLGFSLTPPLVESFHHYVSFTSSWAICPFATPFCSFLQRVFQKVPTTFKRNIFLTICSVLVNVSPKFNLYTFFT